MHRLTFIRTYFANRISAIELANLVERREPFFLENVTNEGESARRFAALVQACGMTCRIDDRRYSWLAMEARTMLPFWVQVLLVVRPAVAAALRWLRGLGKPAPDYIVIMRKQALQVRCRTGPPTVHSRTP
jgi:hypothetical protein